MSILKGACLIGQSGGPTAAINATALGCIEAARSSSRITNVYGAAHGIKGVLSDRLYDLSLESEDELAYMRYTPAAVFGTCRYKLADNFEDETEYQRIHQVFEKYNIRYFFYIGGNDSMDTCQKISRYLSEKNYDCRVIGIPKTIDNDLAATDHCPGYGSAAKYVATTCMEVYRDAMVYDTGSITVIEIMGRNAGWLAAASAIATAKGMGPDLIYLPEIPFDLNDFSADVARVYEQKGDVMVAVSEGIRDKEGILISSHFSDLAKDKDAFGHVRMGGLAASLANHAQTKFKDAKVRGIEFGLIQRCASHLASATDIEESYSSGRFAFHAAVDGATSKMVALHRLDTAEYRCENMLVDLANVANVEKKVPREWINHAGNGIMPAFIDYAQPLIMGEVQVPSEDGLPRFAHLNRIMTRER